MLKLSSLLPSSFSGLFDTRAHSHLYSTTLASTDAAEQVELQSLDRDNADQSSTSRPSDRFAAFQRAQLTGKMKFATSLVFNAVPEWTSFYINYEQLKTAIYRFERQALAAPATHYRDDEEATGLLGTTPSSSTNEKAFTRLLDQELHKITDFYVEKERELLGDVVMLQADIERLEEEQSGLSGRGATSGGSDSEDGAEDSEAEDDDGGVAARFRRSMEGVFSNPRKYDAASRKVRTRRAGSSASVGKSKRTRALSNASQTSNLLDLAEEDATLEAQVEGREPVTGPEGEQLTAQPGLRRFRSSASGNRQSWARRRDASAVAGDDDEEGYGYSDWAIDTRIMYKRRVAALFTSLSELKQYVELNYQGFRKVLKKFDKVTDSSLRDRYMTKVVDTTFPFESTTQERLAAAIQALVPMYANLATNGDHDMALKQLNAHLREHVVWERNTVWREMIGLERRGWGAGAGSSSKRGATDIPIVQSQDLKTKSELVTPVGRFSLPSWLTSQVVIGAFALGVFVALLNVQWFDRVEEQNCLALLVFVTILWALEVVPLFVTSLMVPFLVVVLRVLRSSDGQDKRLTASESTKYIFGQMFSPTIMLLLGGFTLAAALSKQNIDKVLATKVLSLAGTKPRSVLLAYMSVACFASMWISNVAAPVLCYSLIQPILRTLPPQSPFSKSLILGIALASNIGGMASPISSPQNLIALEYMNPPISWLGWFAVSIPVASCTIFIIWLILLWTYRAGAGVTINPVRVNRAPWTTAQYFVSAVTILTIVLWCIESKLAWLLGDMGIIAIVPIVLFYGSGVLRKSDFDSSPFSIVFLAMGGIALGKAVLSSGLLDDMDHVIQQLVVGLNVWPILVIFSLIVLVIATVISHTIASVLVVPIAAQIGAAMDTPHSRLLIFATALICSAGMGLPISGFPNLQAINVEDDMGQRYLENSDFFKVGGMGGLVATFFVCTVGYLIMRLQGL